MDSLSPQHRAQLKPILVAMQANRKGQPALTHNPGIAIDGEAVEVAEPVKVYKRKPFDQSESLKEYRAAIYGDGDTLAQIEAIEREQNGGDNEQS